MFRRPALRPTLVAELCLGALVAALGPAAPAAGGSVPGPTGHDVVLVSIDTLRADHLGCYGYTKPTSPHLDRLAGESILFERVVASAPTTLLSHASLFTSLHPAEHGAGLARRQPLGEEHTTLTEVLARGGWDTAAFHGGGLMAERWGLYQGFDHREEVHRPRSSRFERTVQAALAWLEGRGASEAPFFLFLHSYEIHHPYRPAPEHLALFDAGYEGPLPDHIEVDEHLRRINGKAEPPLAIDDADLAHIVATYDGEIRSMDLAVGELVDGLRRLGLYDDTLIVFTSDHGEEFGEHGKVGVHAGALWDERLRVPLIVKLPAGAQAGVRRSDLARGIDVAPTVLAAVGLAVPAVFRGEDLLARIDSERVAISQARAGRRRLATTVQHGRWKLNDGRLFDLEADPGETRDLAERHPERVRALEALRPRARRRSDAPISLSDGERAGLEALGYLLDEPAAP